MPSHSVLDFLTTRLLCSYRLEVRDQWYAKTLCDTTAKGVLTETS